MHIFKTALVAAVAGMLAFPAMAQDTRPDFVIAVNGLYRSIEPIDGNSTNSQRIMDSIYDPIVGRNYAEDPEGGELRPGLATAWEQVDDLTWHFTIREGVKFHNGQTMTAEDVAFTLSPERIWGENALVPAGTRYTESFASVTALDDKTVEVKTTIPDPNLPYRFVTPLGFVVPKAAYLEQGVEKFGQLPIGTGPYKVVEFDPASHVKLEAFDDYWGGKPPLKSIEFRIVPEFSARIAGMVSGEFDLMVNTPVDEIETVKSYPGLHYVSRPGDNYIILAYNTLELPEFGPNPVADVNLRYAMSAAIDRETLVSSLWGDATIAPAPFNFPDSPAYYDPSIKPLIGYDPEAAKAYLAKSNYKGEEVQVNLVRGAYPNFDLAMEYVAEQWRNLGINVTLNIVDSWPLALQHPFGVLNMSMSTTFDGTPTRSIWGFWGPDSARATREADRSWAPPAEFVEIGRQYLAEPDVTKKVALFRQMVDIWEKEQPGLMLWRSVVDWVVSDKYDWTTINSNAMLLGPGYLTVK
ncbi:ABC transporter substrate-binding protein [Paradevosia shaoguanensis]|uniref:ABC transporter substrate-binding protein n=1 Tax=Paradevosia shaoguanensis TaxID=1335043 RepID=A0AA41QPX5_9HYPH|nr:ABC transporter substrate-binding protein [Paradevosia shaoguanensis]MCF1744367.1 ABC transporter substrate-binding protein [Paradevosia shaoguanensis]MCI0128850.1 ABC transporter substrate-binding protein [Paradevosia shaoguanensis]